MCVTFSGVILYFHYNIFKYINNAGVVKVWFLTVTTAMQAKIQAVTHLFKPSTLVNGYKSNGFVICRYFVFLGAQILYIKKEEKSNMCKE